RPPGSTRRCSTRTGCRSCSRAPCKGADKALRGPGRVVAETARPGRPVPFPAMPDHPLPTFLTSRQLCYVAPTARACPGGCGATLEECLMRRSRLRWLTPFVALGLVAAACGD